MVHPVINVPHACPLPPFGGDLASCVPPGLTNRTYVGLPTLMLLKTELLSQPVPAGAVVKRVESLIVV